jgi:flavodoxin
MNNKCIIIYESIYNENTLKLAKAMAQTLGCTLVTTDRALKMNLDIYEVIGFGSGIYFGKHHPKLFEVVAKLNSKVQDVFHFFEPGKSLFGEVSSAAERCASRKRTKILLANFRFGDTMKQAPG